LPISKGLLPLSADAIDKAISINGVAAELNQQAFRWGRRAALERAAVEKSGASGEMAEPILPDPGRDRRLAHGAS
jgi:indolepyruvate ferredoxin oxidoreductase